ncbi:subtilisin-like protease sdd1 [Phtheirospermum japonicum]|uniref:Subtilisin-like protease sdd1 n=1 Tax=Phtheirospermum japonicum TaxID=374723 RepID=A0A830BH15_9LAMI|nr:subtilisin-like protease sdd1 [Phtheirospermum japonicum]
MLSRNELDALKKSPGFLSAYPDGVIKLDTTQTYKFLSLNTATGLWPASQYGKDVIIGVVDSGIWPESPSFHDGGMTEIPARWKGICQGYRAAYPDDPIIMDSARDERGHGTHVASIAAGNYVHNVSFFGYAPGTARGGVASDTLAGIDQAVADGVDILSISLSAEEIDLYENPLSIASFGARERGVLVCFSAGNRGPSLRTITTSIPWAVIVASGTVDRWFAGTLTLGNDKTITGWSLFPARATVRNLPLIYN